MSHFLIEMTWILCDTYWYDDYYQSIFLSEYVVKHALLLPFEWKISIQFNNRFLDCNDMIWSLEYHSFTSFFAPTRKTQLPLESKLTVSNNTSVETLQYKCNLVTYLSHPQLGPLRRWGKLFAPLTTGARILLVTQKLVIYLMQGIASDVMGTLLHHVSSTHVSLQAP